MIWAGHVAHKAELRNAYVVKLEGNDHLEHRDRFDDNAETRVW
jgi:hypothetical protein